jgi:hypothetical protein
MTVAGVRDTGQRQEERGNGSTSGVAGRIKNKSQNWAKPTLKDGAAAGDQYQADDILATDPTGRVTRNPSTRRI